MTARPGPPLTAAALPCGYDASAPAYPEPRMNAPAWRVWLVVALMCGWGILAIRFVQQGNVAFALLCALLLITNGVTLWRLTRRGK